MTVICLLVAQVFQMLFLVGKFPQKKQCMHFQKYYSVCMSYVSVLLWVSKSPVPAIPRVLFEVRGVAHGANGKKTSS